MNPMVIFPVGAAIFLSWILSVTLKAGEYTFRSSRSLNATSRVRRDESPGLYWCLVAAHVGFIAYLGSLVFSL